MLKEKKEKLKNPRKLLVILLLSAIILTVSTYAWFTGMRSVGITNLSLDIAVADSLLLSLDGESWTTDITINQDMIQEIAYDKQANKWSKLIPISTVGEMDANISRMILFERTSFTATPGGYRLIAHRINNTGLTEGNGYIAFDFFVKNFSGSHYINELRQEDEEAIFLNDDAEVIVSSNGVAGTGIENSIRLAFSQVGRVNGVITDSNIVREITCKSDPENNVTGICRTAQIWEPNSTKHVLNAISWYNSSCLARKGANLTLKSSYGGSCGEVKNGSYYPTYAVANKITSSDRVDIYDGSEYNGYTATRSSLLNKFPYFTDEMKNKEGTERPEFMSLAPNSITKIRIYIYIEGQDIDNYEFAQIGKKMSIKFGFTKERFDKEDVDYNGPDFDSTLSIITIIGDNPAKVALGSEYEDSGATAEDNVDGDITDKITADSNVDTSESGTYRVTYTVIDNAGNKATKIRYVIVE